VGALVLKVLTLNSFRNVEHARLIPSERLNLIVGQNAQGKTSILESIYLLSTSQLLRGVRDSEAIRHGDGEANVVGVVGETETEIGMRLRPGIRKVATLNGMNLKRPSDLIGRLPSVSFSIEDLLLVRGEPTDRRLFLDTTLCQLYPSYLGHLAAYRRSLEQRNALLKFAQESFCDAAQFEPWELDLAHHGSALRSMRLKLLDALAQEAARIHAEMASGEILGVEYETKDEARSEEALLELYVRTREKDIHRGATQIGPHRDDLDIQIGGKDGRLYGSQGQQRTGAVSIKMACLSITRDILGVEPVLLMDDIFAELDVHRRARLVEVARRHAGQVIMTCTEPEQAGSEFLNDAQLFHVNSGRVVQV